MAFPILGVLGAITGIIEKLIPDPQKAAEAKIKLFELAQAGDLKELEANLQIAIAQTEVNKVEAESPGWFRGGWRPFVGWTCGGAFALNFVILPLLNWFGTAFGFPVPPALDLSEMLPVLLGMLGLGGMRSFERVKGKAGAGAGAL